MITSSKYEKYGLKIEKIFKNGEIRGLNVKTPKIEVINKTNSEIYRLNVNNEDIKIFKNKKLALNSANRLSKNIKKEKRKILNSV